MAFIKLLCTSKAIEKRRRTLHEEKKIAVAEAKGQKVKYTFGQKYIRCCAKINPIQILCSFSKETCIYKLCYNLRHDGTCENFVLKSILGFFGGFCLTYIFFMFFVFQLNFKLSTATIMCAIFGSILTIGLAFSYKVRCIVFLLLPQFFSKRGRQALLAYAFILAITGPAKNTLHNMSILSESLACGQEQLKSAVKQILEVIKKPFLAIKDAIKAVIKTVKLVVKKIKEILLAIKRIILSIIKVVKAAFQFLAKILSICNKELGTPFERCGRVFEDAISDCHAKLGPLFDWLCSVAYLTKHICYIVKLFDFVCLIVDFISDSIIGVVIRKIKSFVRHIRTMFYVRIKFSHSFKFETNQSKSMSEIASGIVTEIKERSEGLMKIFDFMSCATSFFFMFIIFRVVHYRYKFLTNERFDNKFITIDFRQIDLKRAQYNKETVLPLNHRERTMYISVGSLRLVKKEKVQLSQSAVVLLTATMKLSTHMIADYSLYWVLSLIRQHGRFQSKVPDPKIPTLNIEGKGLLADLLRSIVKAFQPVGINLQIDTVPCLPDPIPPDYDRYVQIVTSLVLCWFLTIFEPYGLRLRHSIMCYYHPLRAKERSIWLYNHILRSRSSFLKFARRQLKRKCTGDTRITKITLKEYLRDNLQCWCLRLCLGSDKQICCLLCGEIFRESDKVKPIRCQTPGCPGTYCEQCFNDLQNLCTVCLDPVQYGDLSDISEAKGSSSEDNDDLKKYRKRYKKKTIGGSETHAKNTLRNENQEDDDENYQQDISALLIPYPENESDSYNTNEEGNVTEVSTDYSYSYQETKDISSVSNYPIKMSFTDVEKQHIPDYASMATFHEDYNPEISQFETSSFITDYDPMTIPIEYDEYNSPDSLTTDRISHARAFKDKKYSSIVTKSNKEEVLYKPQVENSNQELGFASGSSYITELEEVIDYLSPRSAKEIINDNIPEGDIISITLTTNEKNTESTSISVPELDLSFLNDDESEEGKSSCKCDNPECTRQPCTCKSPHRFDGSVKVAVIDETSRSASSDHASSSFTIVRMLHYNNSSGRRHQLPLPKRKYIKRDGVPLEIHGTTSYYQSESSKSLSVNTEGSQNLESSSQISQNESSSSSLNNTRIDRHSTPPNTSSDSIALTETKAKMNIFESSDSNGSKYSKINPSEYYRKLNRKYF